MAHPERGCRVSKKAWTGQVRCCGPPGKAADAGAAVAMDPGRIDLNATGQPGPHDVADPGRRLQHRRSRATCSWLENARLQLPRRRGEGRNLTGMRVRPDGQCQISCPQLSVELRTLVS